MMKGLNKPTAATSAANTTGTTVATTTVAAPAVADLTAPAVAAAGSKRKFNSPTKKIAAANIPVVAGDAIVAKAPAIKHMISAANIKELMRIYRDYPQPDSSSGGRNTVSYSNIKDKSVTTTFQQYLLDNNNSRKR